VVQGGCSGLFNRPGDTTRITSTALPSGFNELLTEAGAAPEIERELRVAGQETDSKLMIFPRNQIDYLDLFHFLRLYNLSRARMSAQTLFPCL